MLWVTLDAGHIQYLLWNVKSKTGILVLEPGTQDTVILSGAGNR